jgi:hypothetical protein
MGFNSAFKGLMAGSGDNLEKGIFTLQKVAE